MQVSKEHQILDGRVQQFQAETSREEATPMFELLEQQIKLDDQKTTTKRELIMRWTLIVLLSVVLFGALYVGIHFLEGS
jgi:hypothetical protein